MLDYTAFRDIAVVDTSLDFWLNNCHARDNALHRDHLIYQLGLKTTRGHVIASKVSLEVNVVFFDFLRELSVCGILHCCRLFTISALCVVVPKILDCTV